MTRHLTAGDTAPDFTLSDAEGRSVSLADYSGTRVIVYFYPKAATPGCTTEACDFRDNLGSLQSAGYQVLGISPDDQDAIRDFAAAESLPFPLLSDPGNATAKAFGAFGEKTLQGRTVEGTLRSTFAIDGEGTLTYAEYDVDPEGHVGRLRSALEG
ncbi:MULTISPECIES: thioredoxin-dependent thiol peroxidase [Brevibacterium]|uniref:thioredoxin-dependent peroxiredoxin n=2 Tax=Brevibacterium TaxID=1696 RepID=A0A2N6PEE8_9MICO|nr:MULTISPECIES: thioredoxin-dependent thiol peroxidase [Brevibacterium]MBD8019812.1 thioredoxin-dependent thiol peroxidase [Brevibacterium gallinarum]PMB97046.1 thioredoxin-dependent thiol peroxidase [Brevibacterium luteolum]QIN29452.1 thioredoxin-dependent thiol peroxidase [Brevibacterium luteolum]